MDAALKYLFEKNEVVLMKESIKQYLKGFKKSISRKSKLGEIATNQKSVLSFDGYIILCKLAFEEPAYDGFHLHLVIAWNTIYRPDDITDIKVNHISLSSYQDCIEINTHGRKGDLEGYSPQSKKVTSNAKEPYIDVY
jgi:hypothetical protein